MVRAITAMTRRSRPLRILLTSALTLAGLGFSITPANALPGAPTITSISSTSGPGSIDITVNFTRANPAATPLSGYLYSTNNGANWKQCNVSGICLWNGTSNTIVIQKLSTSTASAQNGDTYNIVIKECSTGSANNRDATTANIVADLGLQDCGSSSSGITYVGGATYSAPAPSISTSSTINYGTSSPTVVVTGSGFKNSATASDFTIGYGTTGLTGVTSLVFADTYTATFTFTGTAAMGSLTISAKTSAYDPATSVASNTLSISVAAVAPGAPTGLDTTTVRGTEVALTWTAPTSNGGANITTYVIQYSSNSGSSWSTFTHSASTATTINVTGLSSSTAYLFKVAAVNSVGTGSYTSNFGPATTLTPPVVPETPTTVSAGSATSSSLSVSWTAPAVDGGATIDVYQVQYSTDGTSWSTASSTATSPLTVSGLSASTSYVFKVRAHNSVGWGPYSDSSTAVSTSAASSPAPTPQPEVIYAPVITGISKPKVCARGEDNLVVKGSNFKNATITVDGLVVTVNGQSDSAFTIKFGETTEGIKTIKVTNSAGSATYDVFFKMVDKTAFKVFDIPYIYKGGTFLYQFEAFGENTFRITGNLPGGLVLNVATGEISGIPTEEGMFTFVLHADGLCGNDVDVIKLDIDKEIPNAISHRIKFTNPKSKKITGTAQFELKKFLEHIKEISPKQIEPIIYITGGAPDNESDLDSQSAKERRDSLCDIMLTQDVLGQTMLGLFDGEENEIEIFVYWPVVR